MILPFRMAAVAFAASIFFAFGGVQPAAAAGPAATPSAQFANRLRAAEAADPQLGARAQQRRALLPRSGRNALHALFGSATYPVEPSFLAALAVAAANPEMAPPGAGRPCILSAAHPYPVVLVHGTFEDMEDNWGAVAPILANHGYCVYALNYGAPADSLLQAVDPIPQSAAQVAAFFKSVLSATSASRIDVVGHSQGGTVLEYVAKFLGGASYIHDLVALAPSTHGTTASGLLTLVTLIPGANALLGTGCPACSEQEIGSPVLSALDTPPIAEPGPAYTVIETRDDEVITPSTNAFIAEPGVTDEYVQSFCPFDTTDHIGLNYDLVTIQLVLNALDPATAARPNCFLQYPFPA